MDILLLQILGAIGFIECSIKVWEERQNFGDMVYEHVFFLHMLIKSTKRNAAGKLLFWLNMLKNTIQSMDGDFGKQCLLN